MESVKSWRKISQEFTRTVEAFFEISKVSLAFLSEFGGYRQGPRAVPSIDVEGLMTVASRRTWYFDTRCLLHDV